MDSSITNSITALLGDEWHEKIRHDCMFEDHKCHYISISNASELIEAIGQDQELSETDIVKIIEKHSTSKDKHGVPRILLDEIIGPLTQLLLVDKKICPSQLLFKDCQLPVERIQKFLGLVKHNLVSKSPEEISIFEQMQIKEIQFAQSNLDKRSIFKANNKTIMH